MKTKDKLLEEINERIISHFYDYYDESEQLEILTGWGYSLDDLDATDHYFSEEAIEDHKGGK